MEASIFTPFLYKEGLGEVKKSPPTLYPPPQQGGEGNKWGAPLPVYLLH